MKVIQKRGNRYRVRPLDKHTHNESIAAEVRRKRVPAALRTVEPDGLIVAIKTLDKIGNEL